MTQKIHITTLGCSKNEVDSDVLRGQLKTNDFQLVDNPEDSDTIILNTCGFIEDAKAESIDAILEAIELKKQDPHKKVLVAGCLSARYKDELKGEMPEVDAFFGTEDYENILKNLDKNSQFDATTIYKKRDVSTDHHFAYIKISEGCNHKCSFCAIPSMRGKHRSRLIEDIVSEAEALAARGCKELILIAQDSTYYGLDTYKKQRLGDLLLALEKVDGIEWIRVMYAYPLSFPKDVMAVMQNSSKVCSYIDMPLQAVTDHMLGVMNRGTKKEYTMRVLRQLREHVPNITLRSTLIVGHPEETEADFEETKEFLKEFKFNRLGVFTYSEEDGTPSAAMANQIPMDVKIRRMNEIMEIQQGISLAANQKLLGTKMRILVDSYDAESNVFRGRSEADAPEIDNEVVIDYHDDLNIGQLYLMDIYDANEYEIYASLA
jgi:ribosomal protein S12 methylthiotransferase